MSFFARKIKKFLLAIFQAMRYTFSVCKRAALLPNMELTVRDHPVIKQN